MTEHSTWLFSCGSCGFGLLHTLSLHWLNRYSSLSSSDDFFPAPFFQSQEIFSSACRTTVFYPSVHMKVLFLRGSKVESVSVEFCALLTAVLSQIFTQGNSFKTFLFCICACVCVCVITWWMQMHEILSRGYGQFFKAIFPGHFLLPSIHLPIILAELDLPVSGLPSPSK